ncbi:2-dehydropantoate 2-reductase N-terminal domain-containing protein [Kitasatospora gansuensis]|uniref:2-dehydropantoate 2-reductase N-terminal domain-containing protein n=1 Tax=Kitasatospora gansuensis TaxID=258050 RepID=UPI0028A83BCE|nr:2-dehydropantoate 2-reductase N-terminal domain-containing protein [Kitasatospora gansuensis]
MVGAGATGGFFGARLAEAGQDVTFLVRPGRAAVLRERGLRIISPEGEDVITPQLVTAAELGSPCRLYTRRQGRTGWKVADRARVLGTRCPFVRPAAVPR